MKTILRIFLPCIFTIFLLISCWSFLSVEQPEFADPNSTFDVPITISFNAEDDRGRGYFGILLPIGWSAEDSISYSGVHNGNFIYSSEQSDSMEAFDSAPDGYYWWVSVSDSVDSLLEGTVSFIPRIHIDDQTGVFFLDYMFTDRFEHGFEHQSYVIHSGHYPVSVNPPMTATVTNTNNSGTGSLRQKLSEISIGGEITFNLSYPATIILDTTLIIDRKVTITGPESGLLTLSGNNQTGVMHMSAGYVNADFNVNISNLTISNGQNRNGGGINCEGSTLNLANVNISNNYANNKGGGIWCNHSTLNLNNVTVNDNFARYYGGGIGSHMSNLSLRNVTVNNNLGGDNCWGGGIFSEVSELNLSNAIISNNFAGDFAGGIYFGSSDLPLILTNVTIINNSTGVSGGGILGADSTTVLVNTILWNNSPDQIPVNPLFGSESPANIYYSDVMGGWPGIGNIDADPMFVDTANGDYRLLESSPCIDAGIQDTMIIYNDGRDTLYVPPMDYVGAAPDVGAYEYGDPLAIEKEPKIAPSKYTLSQNYPNPFNPSTTIEFDLPKSSDVKIEVYNTTGQKVQTLLNKKMAAGNHEVDFNAQNISSGVYFYRIEAGEFQDVKKMILLR